MIKTFTGPMHSGKTAAMIATYNKIWNKKLVKVFKPNADVRDLGEMRSKDFGDGIPAILIDTFEDILKNIDNNIKTIFIDEVELLTGNIGILSYLSIVKDMDIYVSGLNMTSEQEPFLIMPQIMAISDEVEVIKASCFNCGRDATYTYFDGKKDSVVLVGDKGYYPYCARCLREKRGVNGMKKVLNIASKKKKNVN